MAGWQNVCLIAALAAGFAATGGGTPARGKDQASTRQRQVCGGDEIARGTVGKIVDGRTFVLDDGREVRLAAIEVAPLAAPQDRADRGRARCSGSSWSACGRGSGPAAAGGERVRSLRPPVRLRLYATGR